MPLHEQHPWFWNRTRFSYGYGRQSPLIQLGRLVMVLLILGGASFKIIWTAVLVGSLLVFVLPLGLALVARLKRPVEITGQVANHARLDFEGGRAVCSFWLVVGQQGVKVVLCGKRATELHPLLLKGTRVRAKGAVRTQTGQTDYGRTFSHPLMEAKSVYCLD